MGVGAGALHSCHPGLQAALLWNGKKKRLSKTLSHMLPTAEGFFCRGSLSDLIQTCFKVCLSSSKRSALSKTAFISNWKTKSQGEIFLHGSAPPTCSGHRHDRAGKRAPRIRARHRHKLPFWHEVLPSGRKPHPSSSWVPFLNRVVVQTGEAQWGGRRRYH